MFALYTFTGLGVLFYLGFKISKFYRRLYPTEYRTFEDEYDEDEYNLLCYRINFEDESNEMCKFDLTDEEVEDIDKDNKIKNIVIEYMFNGRLMKYITYKKDITFPIYPFTVSKTKYNYYPEIVILNNDDITSFITPFLGPYCNFYSDREDPIKLEDTLLDHPEYDKLNFKEGKLIMISNEVPIKGRKCITRDLPCKLIWKRHAAVDPRDEHLVSEYEYVN